MRAEKVERWGHRLKRTAQLDSICGGGGVSTMAQSALGGTRSTSAQDVSPDTSLIKKKEHATKSLLHKTAPK